MGKKKETSLKRNIIVLEDIDKIYEMGDVRLAALSGISLSIQKGDFIAIMGSSGSGKSTLMNILGCLDTPTNGRYFLEGNDVSQLSKNELAVIRNKTIGFVFQNFNLLGRTTILENIEVPLIYSKSYSRKDTERIYHVIETLGLKGYQKHYPSQLSGGQQQRVAIARAIINNPALVLADEPTGNLDSVTSKEVINVLQELNQKMGITIVLVTHEHDIAQYAQRIIVLKDGKVQSDSPSKPLTPVSQSQSD